MRKWKPIEEVDYNTVEVLRIDTRDFHCLEFLENGKEEFQIKSKKEVQRNWRKKHRAECITSEQLKTFLVDLKENTGGNKDWRCFTIGGEKSGWDLKYLTLVKIGKNFYILDNRNEVRMFNDFKTKLKTL